MNKESISLSYQDDPKTNVNVNFNGFKEGDKGDKGDIGERGPRGYGITSVEPISISTASGGVSTYGIYGSDGVNNVLFNTFKVYNGSISTDNFELIGTPPITIDNNDGVYTISVTGSSTGGIVGVWSSDNSVTVNTDSSTGLTNLSISSYISNSMIRIRNADVGNIKEYGAFSLNQKIADEGLLIKINPISSGQYCSERRPVEMEVNGGYDGNGSYDGNNEYTIMDNVFMIGNNITAIENNSTCIGYYNDIDGCFNVYNIKYEQTTDPESGNITTQITSKSVDSSLTSKVGAGYDGCLLTVAAGTADGERFPNPNHLDENGNPKYELMDRNGNFISDEDRGNYPETRYNTGRNVFTVDNDGDIYCDFAVTYIDANGIKHTHRLKDVSFSYFLYDQAKKLNEVITKLNLSLSSADQIDHIDIREYCGERVGVPSNDYLYCLYSNTNESTKVKTVLSNSDLNIPS